MTISTSNVVRLVILLGICWSLGTWVLVAFPFPHHHLLAHDIFPGGSAAVATNVQINADDTFSACLLVMDDNHFLIEWLAYHYHVLPLQYLIVATDPRSQTSPNSVLDRWRSRMTILSWNDQDYMSAAELQEAEDIVRRKFGDVTPNLIRHRARQRLFYDKCMRKLKKEGRRWTILTDTDEFLRLNEPKIKELQLSTDNPLTVESPASIRSVLQLELQRPGTNLTKSACIQIPRLRFGTNEYRNVVSSSTLQLGIDPQNFLTQRWRQHAGVDQTSINKISKVIIDVSRVPWDDLVPVESIHRPIKSLCPHRKMYIRATDSVLIINHYLGSWEQYEYRQDARAGDQRSRQQYTKLKNVDAATNTEILPWLQGFVRALGAKEAGQLLHGVGELEPKTNTLPDIPSPSPTLLTESPPAHESSNFMPLLTEKERCAILLFGLPRSFKDLVLPSMRKNLLGPNARYNCDYFVHYFHQTEEPKGRLNAGGKIEPTEILLLEEAVLSASYTTMIKAVNTKPIIEIQAETEGQFWKIRNETVQRYRTTKGSDGHYLYFPWKAGTYEYPTSLDNIVKQWHSIQGAWDLMEISAAKRGVQYTRVGMFRSDVFYVSPIDLYQVEIGKYDTRNNQAIVAPFGAMPVNDRMIYGNYEAVEIWAARRFSLLEKYVHSCERGWAMHSEKFLDGAILPAIRELGISIAVNPDICFLRTRVDYSVVDTDCQLNGETRGYGERDMKKELENILGRNCSEPYRLKKHHRGIKCEPN